MQSENVDQAIQNFPSVDVIMPTLNSARTLEMALESIIKQDYPGEIHIYIIDGGSSDTTIDIAKRYGAHIILQKGIYMHGKDGAYNLGIKRSNSQYILRMDSDNVLVEESFLKNMIYPLIADSSINLSVSLSTTGPNSTCYERFASMLDQKQLIEIAMKGIKHGNYYIVNDMTIGLNNCTVFRRRDYEVIGNFISDISFFTALREKGLSKAAINPECHYIHYGVPSYLSVLKKMNKRVKRIPRIIEDYDLSNLNGTSDPPPNQPITIKSYFRAIILNFIDIFRHGKKIYLCGFLLALVPIIVALIHPISMSKIYFGYLRKLAFKKGK